MIQPKDSHGLAQGGSGGGGEGFWMYKDQDFGAGKGSHRQCPQGPDLLPGGLSSLKHFAPWTQPLEWRGLGQVPSTSPSSCGANPL